MRKWWVGAILILSIFLSIIISESQEKIENPGELYDSSMELYHKGKCEEAIAGFSKIIQSFPKSKLVSYSIYNMGLCHLKMERFQEALQQFELYLKTYSEGDRAKEAERRIQILKVKLKEKTAPPPGSMMRPS